jgi:hypothetical protein
MLFEYYIVISTSFRKLGLWTAKWKPQGLMALMVVRALSFFYTATHIPECFHEVFRHFWTSAETLLRYRLAMNPLSIALRWSNAILSTTAGWSRDFSPSKSPQHAHINVRLVQHVAWIKLRSFFCSCGKNRTPVTLLLCTINVFPRTPVCMIVTATQRVEIYCKRPVLCVLHNKVHLKGIISKEWGADGIMHNIC